MDYIESDLLHNIQFLKNDNLVNKKQILGYEKQINENNISINKLEKYYLDNFSDYAKSQKKNKK